MGYDKSEVNMLFNWAPFSKVHSKDKYIYVHKVLLAPQNKMCFVSGPIHNFLGFHLCSYPP